MPDSWVSEQLAGLGMAARSGEVGLPARLDEVDVDLLEEQAEFIAATLESEAGGELVRFNPNHAPAGSAAGGEFASAAGSGASAQPSAGPGGRKVSPQDVARRKRLLATAKRLRDEADRDQRVVNQLLGRLKQHALAARQHRQAARHAAQAHQHQQQAAKHAKAAAHQAGKGAKSAHYHQAHPGAKPGPHHQQAAHHHTGRARHHVSQVEALHGRITKLRAQIRSLRKRAAQMTSEAQKI